MDGNAKRAFLCQHVEKRAEDGGPVVETRLPTRGAGYCIDRTRDVLVGVAVESKLLVASACVAQNKDLLHELGVTHVLNVAAALPDSFPEVCDPLPTSLPVYRLCRTLYICTSTCTTTIEKC